jgi:hypothetical protein
VKKRTDSRAKGARGEREAAAYLRSLGFEVSRMGRNGYSDADLDCRECHVLSRIHIEVKHNEKFDLHAQLLQDACEQAAEGAGIALWDDGIGYDVGGKSKPWAVLWKRNRIPWRLTFWTGMPGVLVTVTGDERVKVSLLWLSEQNGGAS